MKAEWRFRAAIAALTLIACVRVASTYRVFSNTADELQHIAAGYQYLTGRYTIDVSHPPLGRAMCALPLLLTGVPPPTHLDDDNQRGLDLLFYKDRYVKNLAHARMGNLVFLITAIIALAAWARRTFSDSVAIVAVALFTTMPAVLAHAGLATTDMAGVAGLTLALLALDCFLAEQTWSRAITLGFAIAIGILGKASFFFFFPLCALIAFFTRGPLRIEWRRLAVVAVAVFFFVWGGYKFDFARPLDVTQHATWVMEKAAPAPLKSFGAWASTVRMPAPALAVGLAILKVHDQDGHLAFLMGETRMKGWLEYFPIVFFYKTPLPFLMLTAWGAVLIFIAKRKAQIAFVLFAMAIMASAMTGSINIGVRHVLAIYVPLSIVAAYAVVDIWTRNRDAFSIVTLGSLLVWLFAGVAWAHPDYLAWFNEAAGPRPAAIAVDSNLDWGQDMLRLARVVRERGIQTVRIDCLTVVPVSRLGINAIGSDPWNKTTGWLAVGETPFELTHADRGGYSWLTSYRPVMYVGRSIRLYNIQ